MTDNSDHIILRVILEKDNGNIERGFKIRRTARFQGTLRKFAENLEIPTTSVFTYKKRKIFSTDTPHGLGMRDNDAIFASCTENDTNEQVPSPMEDVKVFTVPITPPSENEESEDETEQEPIDLRHLLENQPMIILDKISITSDSVNVHEFLRANSENKESDDDDDDIPLAKRKFGELGEPLKIPKLTTTSTPFSSVDNFSSNPKPNIVLKIKKGSNESHSVECVDKSKIIPKLLLENKSHSEPSASCSINENTTITSVINQPVPSTEKRFRIPKLSAAKPKSIVEETTHPTPFNLPLDILSQPMPKGILKNKLPPTTSRPHDQSDQTHPKTSSSAIEICKSAKLVGKRVETPKVVWSSHDNAHDASHPKMKNVSEKAKQSTSSSSSKFTDENFPAHIEPNVIDSPDKEAAESMQVDDSVFSTIRGIVSNQETIAEPHEVQDVSEFGPNASTTNQRNDTVNGVQEMTDYVNQLEILENAHHADLNAANEAHVKAIEELKNAHRMEINRLKEKQNFLIRSFNNEKAEFALTQLQATNASQKEIDEQKYEIDEMRRDQADNLNRVLLECETKVQEVKEDMGQQLSDQIRKHKRELKELKEEYEEKNRKTIQQLIENYKENNSVNSNGNSDAIYQDIIKKLKEEHQQGMAALRAEQDEEQTLHNDIVKRLKEAHKCEMNRAQEKFVKEKAESTLRLVKKQKSDHEMAVAIHKVELDALQLEKEQENGVLRAKLEANYQLKVKKILKNNVTARTKLVTERAELEAENKNLKKEIGRQSVRVKELEQLDGQLKFETNRLSTVLNTANAEVYRLSTEHHRLTSEVQRLWNIEAAKVQLENDNAVFELEKINLRTSLEQQMQVERTVNEQKMREMDEKLAKEIEINKMSNELRNSAHQEELATLKAQLCREKARQQEIANLIAMHAKPHADGHHDIEQNRISPASYAESTSRDSPDGNEKKVRMCMNNCGNRGRCVNSYSYCGPNCHIQYLLAKLSNLGWRKSDVQQ